MIVKLQIPCTGYYDSWVEVPDGVNPSEYLEENDLTEEMERNATFSHTSELYLMDWEIIEY